MAAVSVEHGADGVDRTRGAGVDLAFRVRGSGPAVVLLHGTSANHAVWEPIAEALAGSATVVCLDQRGHGRSDRPAGGYTAAEFADDVVTVLDTLGIQRAVVGGHSLGARNAWVAAARHPSRVSAVLAVDYTPYVEPSVLDDLQVRVAGGDRLFTDVAEIEAYLHARYPRMPLSAIARRARWGYHEVPGGLRPLADPHAMGQLVDGLRTPWDAEFAAVAVPLTNIRGVHSKIVSPAAWAAAQVAKPDACWVVADDADHYVPEELPRLVTAELQLLLDAV